MPFARIAIGWVVVVLIFLAWREAGFRRTAATDPSASRPSLRPLLLEAALLVLFAGLWFGSLGSGGGWLLFPLLGALIEVPPRLRAQAAGTPVDWLATLSAVLRIAVSGILLGFILA